MISLDSFKVRRKLSVKNIHIEQRKVKALYQVDGYEGESNAFELIYIYEHSCFDPAHPADVNLASMMLAQVALNYGLFFEIIEFDDCMTKPPYHELKPEKRERYTQSKINFVNTQYPHLPLDLDNEFLDFTSDRGVSWYVHTKALTKSGVMGNATLATAEKGNKIWEVMIRKMAEFVETIKNTPSERLFQNRY